MGSMLKFDSERRELVRERRDARIERKQQRRQARAHKRSHTAETLFTPSAAQRLAERDVQAAVDRIVERGARAPRADGAPGNPAHGHLAGSARRAGTATPGAIAGRGRRRRAGA